MKSYKYRIYPNKEQTLKLNFTLDLCRFTYNKLLEFLNKQEKIDRGTVQHHIVKLKEQYPELKKVYSKALQMEHYKLFSNLRALSKLKQKGKHIGKLRFKGKDFFDTFCYNQSGFKIIFTNKRCDTLHLSKIGDIPIRLHRKCDGNIKQVTIKKSIDKWYAFIITDEQYKLQGGERELGFDMGVRHFLTDSEGTKTPNPLYYNKLLDKIKKAQKNLSRKKKGSKNRLKAKKTLAKLYEKVDNQKKDFFHKVSTEIVNNCKLIGIEDLKIAEMTDKKNNRNRYQNMRNILDSSWGNFANMLQEGAGIKFVRVNPYHTTKKCSQCGYVQDMPLHKRTYDCPNCGLKLDRDHNAAINIKKLAQGLGFVENHGDGSVKQEAIS